MAPVGRTIIRNRTMVCIAVTAHRTSRTPNGRACVLVYQMLDRCPLDGRVLKTADEQLESREITLQVSLACSCRVVLVENTRRIPAD